MSGYVTVNSGNITTHDSWQVSVQSDVTANDSNKEFTVPADTEWQILSVYVSLVTTATVGDRQLAVEVLSAEDVILAEVRAGVVQAASITRKYQFAPGVAQDIAFRDSNYASVALPPLILSAGQKLRVRDKAAVAAAADDMDVHVQVASRSVD